MPRNIKGQKSISNKNTFTVATILFFAIPLVWSTAGCQTVKPYQRVYLNDENMQAGKKPVNTFNEHVHTYREGASGGGSGKSSGGCGCN